MSCYRLRHWMLLKFRVHGRLITVVALMIAMVGAFGMATTVDAATFNVSTAGTDSPSCGSGTPCKTIGQAITNAASGDTVNVAAGTYTEQVTVSKSLTITGAGSTTIIQAPTGTALTANSAGVEVLFDVEGGTVTASGFTVSGPVTTASGCSDLFYGVFVGGATLNLSNATVQNIHNADSSLLGCQQGVGIRYGSQALMKTASGIIDHVAVTGYQKAGIVIDGAGTNVTVTNDTVTGDGPQANIAQNGIQISRGAVATVTGNTVSGDECNVSACGADGNNQTQSGGILLYDAGMGTTISGNTVTGSDAGILRSDDDTSGPSITLTGNILTGNRYESVYLFGGPTTVSMNTIKGPTNIGIQYGQNTATMPPTDTGPVTVQNNTFDNSVTMQTSAPAPTISSVTPNSGFNSGTTNVTIAGTNFVPGAAVKVDGQQCTTVVVATSASLTCTVQPENTTGAKNVVVTNPDNQAGTLTNGFTYNARPAAMTVYVDPAYKNGAFGSNPGAPATAIGYDAFPTIQAGVNAVAAGGTVHVAAGTYTEQVLINKNLTFTGAGVGQTTIQAPSNTGLTSNGLTNGGYHMEVLFDVAGGTVTASNFTINGPVQVSSCGDDFYGVFVRGGATLNLSNASVTNIHASDLANFGGCQTGDAIRYGSQHYNLVGNGSVDHVTVTNYGKNGITVTNNSNVSITNNTVTGAGAVNYIAQNGIEIGANSTATVTGNTVSGNECDLTNATPSSSCGPDGNVNYQASGIIVFDETNGLTIANNMIKNNDAGLLLGDDAGSLTNLTVTGNTFTGNRYEGIYLLGGPTMLSNNIVTGPGNIAIQLGDGTGQQGVPTSTGTVTYQNNTITGYTKTGGAVPSLSGISPIASDGSAVTTTLTGSNLPPGDTVTIGGQPCTNVSIPNSITLICTTPAFTSGGAKDVVLTTPDGKTATLAGGFTVNIAGPVITSLSPGAGPIDQNTQVTINGTGFLQNAQVKVNGQLVSAVYVNDTKIIFTVGAHPAGTVTVTVVTSNGQSSNGATFTYGTVNPRPQPATNAPFSGASLPGSQPTAHAAGTPTNPVAPILPQPVRH